MSDYPATIGDLADVETRLQTQITKLQKTVAGDSEVTDEKISSMRVPLAKTEDDVEMLVGKVAFLETQVRELTRLWEVAKQNPELIRELALIALGDRKP